MKINRLFNKLIILTILFLCFTQVYSQESFAFSRITLEDGLSHSRIYALLQDSRGFLWIGTSNGLNRYDGRSFKYYKNETDNPDSLPHNYVTSLLEDRNGFIWMGTDGGGAARLNPQNGHFEIYSTSQNDSRRRISDDYVWGLLEDRKGNIWMGTTYGGINVIKSESGDIDVLKKNSSGEGLSYNNVWPLMEDLNGDIWIGTDGGGITRWVSSSDRFIHYRHDENKPDSLSSDFVFSLYRDSDNTIWVGTSGGGLNKFDRSNETFTSYQYDEDNRNSLSNNSVRAIFEDSTGRFWIGTTDGLNLMNRDESGFTRIFHYPNDRRSLSHSRIHSIIEDKSGVLWFGTRDGISTYIEPVFKTIPIEGSPEFLPRRNVVRSVLENEEGGLFIGTYQGLFYLKDGIQELVLPSQIVYSLLLHSRGELYAGTDKGFYRVYKDDSGLWQNEFLFKGTINVIKEDDLGDLWIGCEYEGLCQYNVSDNSARWFTPEDAQVFRLQSWSVSDLEFKDSDSLLICTRDNPVLLMHINSSELSYPDENWLKDNHAYHILSSETKDYLALDQRGLLAVDKETERSRLFTEKDGLPSDIIRALSVDDDENLWISTLRGLAFYEKKTQRLYSFGIEDGLPGLIFNPSALWKNKKGHIYFGSTSGLVLLDPVHLTIPDFQPPLAIEVFDSLLMHTNLYSGKDKIELESNNRMLLVKLSAFDFTHPGKIRYAYRFSEKDDWIEIGNQGEIVFSHLAPGDYSLQVHASNSDGQWMDNPEIIRIFVHAPFYLRWFMLVLYFFIILGIIFFLVRIRSRYHLATIREQEKLVESRTEELNEAKLNLENEIRNKSTFFINLAHETKTPLTFIQNYINRYIQNHGEDRDLGIVKENIDKLVRDMVNYLDSEKMKSDFDLYDHNQYCHIGTLIESKLTILKEATKQRDLTLTSEIEENLQVKADPLAIDRIINNLLDNALKYNRSGGSIHILLSADEYNVILKVKDTGKGIAEEPLKKIFDPFYQSSHRKQHIQGIGMGLSIVKQIVENLKAEIFIDTEEGRGSEFTIFFKKTGADEINEFITPPYNFISAIQSKPNDTPYDENRKSIVIIDDDDNMLNLLNENLSEKYNLYFYNSAEEILEKINVAKEPDLIISDIMLGAMDGHKLLEEIQNSHWRSVSFMFLSARGSHSESLKGINEGAVDFIAKPFIIEDLKARIHGQVKRKEMFMQNVQNKIKDSLSPGSNRQKKGLSEEDKIKELIQSFDFSPREEEIFRLMAIGKFNKEIAFELGISVRTVERHVYNLFKKADVQNRIELVNLLH
jgi:signal transduction histidine kinase/ligand-binding sensor domain-containing protein/DNA-binding NarL/FixJ family response regulator